MWGRANKTRLLEESEKGDISRGDIHYMHWLLLRQKTDMNAHLLINHILEAMSHRQR
jgi:hypothetical protein